MQCDSGIPTYRSHGMNWFPRLDRFASKLFIWHGRRLYRKYIEENGAPDIIHAHSLLYAGILANEIYESHQIPFVVTEHSTAFARNLISSAGISLAAAAASNAAMKFAVSEAFAKLLNESFELGESPWTEMPNIVSEVFLEADLKKKNEEKKFSFLNVAFMYEKKKQINILEAFSKIQKCHGEIELIFVGDGPERKKIEKRAVELGIQANVRFTGLLTRDQVLAEMMGSDAFVLASSHETFGVVVIEALALGMPVIATRCGGPESILREKDGILIPVNDVDALAAAMEKILVSRDDYDSEEIRKACAARYSENSIAARIRLVYESCISKEKLPRNHEVKINSWH
ncbi:putative teichuronic acid biosynthesis glycosyltransferase TuaC [compost metagenome]